MLLLGTNISMGGLELKRGRKSVYANGVIWRIRVRVQLLLFAFPTKIGLVSMSSEYENCLELDMRMMGSKLDVHVHCAVIDKLLCLLMLLVKS